jgi:hypothetical protein
MRLQTVTLDASEVGVGKGIAVLCIIPRRAARGKAATRCETDSLEVSRPVCSWIWSKK